MASAEEKLVDFAEDLGRMLGTAQRKADEWLGQRATLTKRLMELRDTATGMLTRLQAGGDAPFPLRGRKRGRPAGSTNKVTRAPGRPAGSGKKKRTMSAEARAKIAAAQRRRWAKQKAEKS